MLTPEDILKKTRKTVFSKVIDRFKKIDREKPLMDQARDVMNDENVRRFFQIGADVAEAITPVFITKDRTPWTFPKAMIDLGKIAVEASEVYSHEFFEDGEWTTPYPSDFNHTILKIVHERPHRLIKTGDEDSCVKLLDLGDELELGWVVTKNDSTPDAIYVKTERLVQSRQRIKQLLWEHFKGKSLVMRRASRSRRDHDNDSSVVFEVDDVHDPMVSEKASRYSAYLQKAITAEVPRALMFYGPPGTGKSTMARTIIYTLGLRSFRIRVEDVGNIENSTVFEAISIFEPDSILLDDFDRCNGQESLFETLEFFKRHIKLVIATVNDRSSLDDALLRPGRFDEMIFVKRLDDVVIKKVLGQYADEAFEHVKTWPIAFIQEYITRRQFMTDEETKRSMKELKRRVESLKKYDDDDDDFDDDLSVNAKERAEKEEEEDESESPL